MPFDVHSKTKQKPLVLIRSVTAQELSEYQEKVKNQDYAIKNEEIVLTAIKIEEAD